MNSASYIKFITFFLLSLLFSSTAFCSEEHILDGDWLFKFGDQQLWSQSALDDSQWSVVKVPGILKQRHQQATVGWYRLHFDSTIPSKQQALLIESLRHSDQTWLNGVNIGALGKFEDNWTFSATNPQQLTRVYPIPQGLLQAKDNLLAIKVAIGFGDAWAAMYPGGAGISGRVLIDDAQFLRLYHQQAMLETSSIDVLFISFALVDILIVLLLIKNALGSFPEFKWLVACSFLMLMGTLSHDFFFIHQLHFFSSNLLLLLTLLSTPIVLALYFWSQNKDLSGTVFQALALATGLIMFLIISPAVPSSIKVISWYVFSLITFLCFGYALYSAVMACKNGRIGSWAQLLAVLVYIYSIRTQWMPHDSFGHRNIQIGSLFYRYALLFAYFQQLAHLRFDYKKLSTRVVNITENTRHALARELHDGLGQHLAAMKIHIQLQNKQQRSTHTNYVESELKNALLNLRRLINGLHPVEIDHCCISLALEQKCQSLALQHPVKFSFNSKEISLDKQIEQHLFRIFQECVCNAITHGKATHIEIELKISKRKIRLKIVDNGVGFDAATEPQQKADGGFGFISLTERITLLDGSINISSDPILGTTVTVSLPCHNSQAIN